MTTKRWTIEISFNLPEKEADTGEEREISEYEIQLAENAVRDIFPDAMDVNAGVQE